MQSPTVCTPTTGASISPVVLANARTHAEHASQVTLAQQGSSLAQGRRFFGRLPQPPLRRLARTGLSALATLIIAAHVGSAVAAPVEPAWVARSNANAKLLLEVGAKYDPESASERGVDGYDE